MYYPADMTAEDIMEFEHEYNRHLDRQEPGSLIPVNEELQEIAYDELERDCDEPYEPVTGCDPAEYDSWYDDQFELDTDYL